MAKISYDYDGDDGSGGGSTFRLIVLVVVIGALTAALIWWIMPRGTASGADGNRTEHSAGAVSAAAGADAAAAGAGTSSPVQPESEAVRSAVDAEAVTSALSSSGAPAGEAERSAAADAEAVTPALSSSAVKPAGEAERSAADTLPTPIDRPPVKGKPWAGDPPEAAPPAPDAAELAEKSVTAANALIFDSGRGAAVILHTVKSGDTLGRIARRNHTTIEAIMRLNRLKSTSIRVGQKLAVLPGPWRIEIAKSRKKLRLFRKTGAEKEELFFGFDIGIGRKNSTPKGDFVICLRVRRPDWTAPDGAVYPHGDPGNPLGDYFLKLSAAKSPDKPLGFGIHGSRDGEGIGLSISSGCIRMRNREVELLWLALPVGSPVSIKD